MHKTITVSLYEASKVERDLTKTYNVAVIAFPEVEELDLTGVWEALGATQHFSKEDQFRTQTVGIEPGPIKCAHGLTILPDEHLSDLAKYDVIVVPGGPGTQYAMKNERLLDEIRKASENGKLVCSVCTGAFVLAKAGILQGKKATTYHTHLEKLSNYGAIPLRERVIVEGKIVTGAGVSASIDVGLKIIEILMGQQTAAKAAELIEYPP